MTVLSTNCALDGNLVFGLERACPSPVSFELAIIAIIIVYSLNLQIIAIKQILEFLIFFSIQNFLNFLDSSLKLVIVVGYDDDMEGLIVFEDILLGFIGSSASHCNFTA